MEIIWYDSSIVVSLYSYTHINHSKRYGSTEGSRSFIRSTVNRESKGKAYEEEIFKKEETFLGRKKNLNPLPQEIKFIVNLNDRCRTDIEGDLNNTTQLS